MKTGYFLPFAVALLFELSFSQVREDLEEKRQEWFYFQRAYPKTELEPGLLLKALQTTRADRRLAVATQTSNIVWQSAGPTPIAGEIWACNDNQYVYENVSGRVTALCVDPADPNVVYCGGAFGGVWKSTDAGAHWFPITDGEATLAVGSIAIDPNNHSIVYAGTGEANGSGDSYYGLGILKSTDGGGSWNRLGANEFAGRAISKILVDPSNSNRVWVTSTTSRVYSVSPPTGVLLSTDGGLSWTLKSVVNASYRAYDIAVEPGNSNVVYTSVFAGVLVSGRGIYKSTDGGDSWAKLTNGLPTADPRRISLAIAPSRPQRIYSGWASNYSQLLGVYVSDDSGAIWSKLPNPPPGTFGIGGSYNYYNVLAVSPTNPDRVFFGGLHLWRTNDSLSGWTTVDDGCTAATVTHVDHHALAFGPDGTLYDGNDGGVWKTTDEGASWANLNSSLSLTQFVSVSLHPSDSTKGVGGSQDNGYELITGAPLWTQTFHGDGGFCDWNFSDLNTIYGTYVYNYIFVSRNGGIDWELSNSGIDVNDNVAFYAPLKIDPDSAHWVYFGTDRLYRSTDTGHTWTPTTPIELVTGGAYLTAIAVSRPDKYGRKGWIVGSFNGLLLYSVNGTVWDYVGKSNIPGRWVTDFEISPVDAGHLLVSFSGFNSNTPGVPGHVFRTLNAGGAWTDISGNLPDVPVNTILADPKNFNTVLAGTDVGVFITFDGGANWQKFGAGIPNVAVVDLRYNSTTRVLAAATHGRGMYWVRGFDLTSPCTLGDMNGDTGLSPADAVLMLNCVFLDQGSCSLCFTDVNCDGSLTPADVVIELNMVFLGAAPGC